MKDIKVRLSEERHAKLAAEAKAAGISLNALIGQIIAQRHDLLEMQDKAIAAQQRASDVIMKYSVERMGLGVLS